MDLSFPVCLRLLRLFDILGEAPLLGTTTTKHNWVPTAPPAGPMFPVHLISIETLVYWPEIA